MPHAILLRGCLLPAPRGECAHADRRFWLRSKHIPRPNEALQADARDTAPPGSKRARLRDKKRRQMSLGAVVAMEQHKYTDEGLDTFDCAMEEFMEQTNLDVRRPPPTHTPALCRSLRFQTCRLHLARLVV